LGRELREGAFLLQANSGDRGLEYWSTGVLEYWSTGVLEYWSTGVLEYWSQEFSFNSSLACQAIREPAKMQASFCNS
jgi:hypothetical protein